MEEETADPSDPSVKSTLPVILMAALVEGWGLYGLHHSIEAHSWPATDSAWLMALYGATIFGPLTAQLIAKYARDRFSWLMVAMVAGVFLYFGWHRGAIQIGPAWESRLLADNFEFALPLAVLWLLMLPFIQGRLEAGRWSAPYATLFANAWRNKLTLAEAALFTGLLWLLLELWQTLFHMLSIDFFRELFEEPIFVYPVTAIAFGIALHLIGSIDRLTSVVLEQLLNVLKWLAVVAGTLLLLFTLALAVKLPGLFFSGERAIGAAWLLWLVAVLVLLLNAAYRDGSVTHPYPRWIGAAVRFTVPLTVIISATAIYALFVRTQRYGITVERVWAYVVAAAAVIYSVGYSFAAFIRGPWMGRIGRVNVLVAIALMLVIAVTLTPLMSPQRLSANSQFKVALTKPLDPSHRDATWDTPFHYLRFDAGTYGLEKLRQLASLQNHPDADRIRFIAAAELAQQNPWQPIETTSPEEFRQSLADIPIYPQGRALNANLVDAVVAARHRPGVWQPNIPCSPLNSAGVFVDLNGDNVDEFILLEGATGTAFENRDGRWQFVGTLYGQGSTDWHVIRDRLIKGDFSATTPKWKSLSIGGHSFRVNEEN